MANIAFFNSHTLWPVHYETELEIIQNYIDSKDNIYQIVCNGSITTCDLNLKNNSLSCFNCIEKRKKGIGLLNINKSSQLKNINYSCLNSAEINRIKQINFQYNSIAEIQKLKIENFDIGLAVLSSIISETRDSALDLKVYRNLIDSYLLEALLIFESSKKIIQTYRIDKFYIFNGRFAYPRAVLRACEQKGIDYYLHETGGTIFKYEIFKNHLPHNIIKTQELIETFWKKSTVEEREKFGHLFFTERENAIPQSYISFVSEQKLDLLPESWDEKKHNIVIFNSSEDEMASIGDEWQNPIYKNQLEGILKVVDDFKKHKNIMLYLRMHPNLKNVNDDYVKTLNNLQTDNFERIAPDSPISTYTLMKKANKVISFGSYTGIETAYFGGVSILLGKGYYYGKNAVYEPKNHHEAIEMITNLELKPIISDFPLKFGNYFKNRGIDYKHYKPTKLFNGTYNGVELNTYKTRKQKILDRILLTRVAQRFDLKNKRKLILFFANSRIFNFLNK